MWVLLGWLWCVGEETTFKDQDKREWWSLVIKSWVAGSPFTSSMEEFKNVPLLVSYEMWAALLSLFTDVIKSLLAGFLKVMPKAKGVFILAYDLRV